MPWAKHDSFWLFWGFAVPSKPLELQSFLVLPASSSRMSELHGHRTILAHVGSKQAAEDILGAFSSQFSHVWAAWAKHDAFW